MWVNSVKDMTKFGKRYGNLQRMQSNISIAMEYTLSRIIEELSRIIEEAIHRFRTSFPFLFPFLEQRKLKRPKNDDDNYLAYIAYIMLISIIVAIIAGILSHLLY